MIIRLPTLALIVLLCFAQVANATALDGQCAIHFYGKSTLHDFDGQVSCQPFVLEAKDSDNGRLIIQPPAIEVLVNEMNTDNDDRDKKMRVMFDSVNFPAIMGRLNVLEMESTLQRLAEHDPIPGGFEFDLQIRDVTQHIKANATRLKQTPERIDFVLEFPLSLSSFALKPPSVLGLIRVADQVRVEVVVTLKPHSARSLVNNIQ